MVGKWAITYLQRAGVRNRTRPGGRNRTRNVRSSFTTGGRNRTRKCQNRDRRDRRVWQGLRAESTDVDVARRQGCALCSRRGLSSGAINLRGPTAEFLDAGTRGSSRTSLLVRS